MTIALTLAREYSVIMEVCASTVSVIAPRAMWVVIAVSRMCLQDHHIENRRDQISSNTTKRSWLGFYKCAGYLSFTVQRRFSFWESPTYQENANSTSDYVFVVNPPLELTELSAVYQMQLFDFDTFDADDDMGGVPFQFILGSGGFPSEMTIDAGGAVAFRIHVAYEFD